MEEAALPRAALPGLLGRYVAVVAAAAAALGKLGVMADDDGLNLPGGLRFDVVKGRLQRLMSGEEASAGGAGDGLMLALAGAAVSLLVFFVVA